jgi:hypothetical protein
MATTDQFFVRSDLVVTGYDAEFADISNPRGALYGEAFYVVIEAHDGRRWAHDHRFVTRGNDGAEVALRAERLRARIEASYNGGAPLDGAHWVEIDPLYGSDAYVSQGVEAERAAAERRAERA